MCRGPAGAPGPEWVQSSELFCLVRTADELSVVCPENRVETNHPGWTIERGWTALKLEGPFPFSMTGVLASFLQPLADAKIPIFAISTFDTDYVLIKHDDLLQAQAALRAEGHELAG